MALYLIKADRYDYDDYDSILVRAQSEALALAMTSKSFTQYQRPLHVSVVEVEGPEEVIISSFNAG